MKKTSLIVMIVAISLSGCGTVCNLAGGVVHPDSEPRVYGGVIRDVEIIEKAVSGPLPTGTLSTDDGKGAVFLVTAIISLAAVDPILSFVADTLTLPVTIPLQSRRTAREQAIKTTP